MGSRVLGLIDTAIIVVVIVAVVGFYVAEQAPHAETLVVWSCGGNYHALNHFAREFEQRHGVKVRYTAAPVEYLLEQIVAGEGHPDLIVGRAGPGWEALEQVGKLSEGPDSFAADPYVIITPAGNPGGVTGVEDLQRPSVRVAYSPHAMRPKGKCPSHLMGMLDAKVYPSLAERWENNAIERSHCARDLLRLIEQGRADAAIVASSMTRYPGVDAEAIEVVPIPVKHQDMMKSCRGTIGQCVGVLAEAANPEMARRFRDEMLGETGRQVFESFGYIHISSSEIGQWKPFLKTFIPKQMPPWQVLLGDMLADAGIHREALRRYLKVIYTFGPNPQEAYCRYRAGELLAEQGNVQAAIGQWRRLLRDFPRTGPSEYGGRIFAMVCEAPELDIRSDEHYVALARSGIEKLAGEAAPPQSEPLPGMHSEPPMVIDGDPPKNGTREFALAEDLFLCGEYEYATRDYLKVVHLCYSSRYAPQASYKIGLCDWMRGHHDVARRQWRRTIERFPTSTAARDAAAAVQRAGAEEAVIDIPAAPVEMPAWEPIHDTWPERGMTYGMALYEHRLPLFAFKEMVKLLHGEYGQHEMAAQARYRAGVAAWAAGHPDAAVLEWRLCESRHAGSAWTRQAHEALQAARAWTDLPQGQRAALERALDGPLPSPPKRNKPPCWMRYCLAREFIDVGVLDQGQAALELMKALTVTRASGGKYDTSVVPKAEAELRKLL